MNLGDRDLQKSLTTGTVSAVSGIANNIAVDGVQIVGAGLAGCEAAWQAAEHGLRVDLFEMRPGRMTPAHQSDGFAELVCSNSLGSALADRATGVLQEEMRRGGSLLLAAATATRIPAGGSLAVDRQQFAAWVGERIRRHPLISVHRQEVVEMPAARPLVLATGPLTSEALAADLAGRTGGDALYFYDAMAPIVEVDTVDRQICFRASRYERGQEEQGDYLNCPLDRQQYDALVAALLGAQTCERRAFEQEDPRFFEGCLPVEELARRGPRTLAFGPLRPVGLTDPRTGRRPYAVVQLRQDNQAGTLYNLVGFQTNLTFAEQQRVWRLIPGLEQAEFVRFGQMHRNTFLNAPAVLGADLQLRGWPAVLVAGQLAGVEGYMGSVALGWLAGRNAVRLARGQSTLVPPATTMTGALVGYLSQAEAKGFQPMKANFGLLPPLPVPLRGKRERAAAMARRAVAAWDEFLLQKG